MTQSFFSRLTVEDLKSRKPLNNSLQDATALRRGVSRSRLQRKPLNSLQDATALRRGVSARGYNESHSTLSKMPRPCAVESHARGYNESHSTLLDAMALRRGVSRLMLLVINA